MKAVHARTSYAFAGVNFVRSGWLRAHTVWIWGLFLVGLYGSRRGCGGSEHDATPERVTLRASARGCGSWHARCGSWGCRCIE